MNNQLSDTVPSGIQTDWIRDAVFYEIFVDRFANARSDLNPEGVVEWGQTPTRANFFGGDLDGIRTHLDHIQELGANALWLTPIFAADTNHRYDTADYTRIDYRLGTTSDFRALVAAVHERGMKIILDAVFNHSGEGFWAFRHLEAWGDDSPYKDWYHVISTPIQRIPTLTYDAFGDCPYLPTLNHANPDVRAHLFAATQQWLDEDIDGWRLDVPYLVSEDFWRPFRMLVKTHNPSAYIVGEVWELATAYLQGDMFDGTMNYPLKTAIVDYAGGTISTPEMVERLKEIDNATPEWARPGMLNLIGSHDTQRIRRAVNDDPFAVRLAIALQLTSEGAPLIYYGDEIGLEGGDDPDCRRTMPWDESTWDRDLFDFYHRFLAIRRDHAALRWPGDVIIPAPDDVMVRRRGAGEDAVWLVVNRAPQDVWIPIAMVEGAHHDLLGGSLTVAGDGSSLAIPARSLAVLARS